MALANLTSRWAALDSAEYPGAGFGSLTPDGRLDPLLAYAYDSVVALAGAIFSVQQEAELWGGALRGFVAGRWVCVCACVCVWVQRDGGGEGGRLSSTMAGMLLSVVRCLLPDESGIGRLKAACVPNPNPDPGPLFSLSLGQKAPLIFCGSGLA